MVHGRGCTAEVRSATARVKGQVAYWQGSGGVRRHTGPNGVRRARMAGSASQLARMACAVVGSGSASQLAYRPEWRAETWTHDVYIRSPALRLHAACATVTLRTRAVRQKSGQERCGSREWMKSGAARQNSSGYGSRILARLWLKSGAGRVCASGVAGSRIRALARNEERGSSMVKRAMAHGWWRMIGAQHQRHAAASTHHCPNHDDSMGMLSSSCRAAWGRMVLRRYCCRPLACCRYCCRPSISMLSSLD